MAARCTKCGVKEALEKYIVDRDTAYCADCASLLRLGTSREALKMDQGVPHSTVVEEDSKEEESGETV